MTPLITRLKRAVEFDGRAWPIGAIGAKDENVRLAPIISALIELLESHSNTTYPEDHPRWKALAKLEKVVGE